MKGYPKHIATKQDCLNLLADPEYRERILTDLQSLYELQDDTLERVVSYDMDDGHMINVVTETIPAPMPKWKRMGFQSREEVMKLMTEIFCP